MRHLLVAVGLLAWQAQAFEIHRSRLGARAFLPDRPVNVVIDGDGRDGNVDLGAVLPAALLTWSSTGCVELTSNPAERAVVVHVGWSDSWPWSATLAAHTNVDLADDGQVRGATILLHRGLPWGVTQEPTELDLPSVVVHELGHALGLDHSRDPRALMAAGTKPGVVKRGLAVDDIHGVCALKETPRRAHKSPWAVGGAIVAAVSALLLTAVAVRKRVNRGGHSPLR